jgi:hypothetical protein
MFMVFFQLRARLLHGFGKGLFRVRNKITLESENFCIEHPFDGSPPNVGPREQCTDWNLEHFRQVEHLHIEDRAMTRLNLGYGFSRDVPTAMLELGRKCDLRPTMPIPQFAHLRSYDISVPHSFALRRL